MGFDLDRALDELYGAPLPGFVAVRTRLAKQARAEGDTGAAQRLAGVAKPTTAAWLANQVARVDEAAVAALVALGEQLRDATDQLDGARLRSLSSRRSTLVSDLVRRAGAATDRVVSPAVARELESIFTAALADPDLAAGLVAGRLTSATEAAPGWPAPTTVPGPRRVTRPAPAAESAKPSPEIARAQAQLDAARAAVKDAEAARTTRHTELEDAEAAARNAATEILRLTRALDDAEQQQRAARDRVTLARRVVKDADRSASQAWRNMQQAEQALAEFED